MFKLVPICTNRKSLGAFDLRSTYWCILAESPEQFGQLEWRMWHPADDKDRN